MKYTLNTYGWSSEFVGKSLTKDQTEQIENLKKARGVENLWEIRFDIDDEMDFDIFANKKRDFKMNDDYVYHTEHSNFNNLSSSDKKLITSTVPDVNNNIEV